VVGLLFGGASASAGVASTDVFLAMAGRQAGVHPSNWYTAVWIHNPGAEAATARVYWLERGTANPSPPWVDVLIGPGDTETFDNVVEALFHVEAFGALRVTCATQKLVVTSRVYSQVPGAGARDSVGQDFAGVPASFAIGLGERTTVLGVHQTPPGDGSDYRYNFGFVETTGHSATVRVRAFDDNGAEQGSVDLQVRELSQRQVAFRDHFPAVDTESSRLEVEVIAGAGRIIAYGSSIANGSQDPTTFEMQYPDALLGIATVQHDGTLIGDGTATAPLGVADGGVATEGIADGAVTVSKLGTSLPPAPLPAGVGMTRADPLEAMFKIGDVMFWDLAFTGDITAVNTAPGSGLTGGVAEGVANLAIASGGVTTEMLGHLAVTGNNIASDAVGMVHLADRSVGLEHIVPAPEDNFYLATKFGGQVVWSSMPGGDISAVRTPAGSGLSGGATEGDVTLEIALEGVTAPMLAGGAVFNSKIAADAVTTDKIADATILGTDIKPATTIHVLKLQGGGTTPDQVGVFGASVTAAGVWGESAATSAPGVHGFSPYYRGVLGEAGGAGTGVWGSSPDGYGVYGISTGNGNWGRLGTPTTGVYGQSASSDGVYGHSTSGEGVHGKSASRFGVYGESASSVGVYGSSTSSWGVYGYTENYIGVQGHNNASGNWGRLGTPGYGGSFHGNVNVDGTLTKDAGAFKIDHPLDPGGKYLYHSFVESPDMKNIYDGVATLGAGGEAVVELPEWFDALNRDFRYQLTCLGGFAQVYIAEEIANNRFRIAGGSPGLRVSWQVTGTRQDAWAEAHRIPVEEVKPGAEQGRYRHPELFGQPEELAVEGELSDLERPVRVPRGEEER
jgi:hypothetical protein